MDQKIIPSGRFPPRLRASTKLRRDLQKSRKPRSRFAAESQVITPLGVKVLHDDLLRVIADYLSEEDLANPGQKGLRFFKKKERKFFQEQLNQAEALKASITGNPELLIKLIQTSPYLLFVKHEKVTDPAGQIFYNISPYQMMLFLCDDDMLKKVMDEIILPEELSERMESQKAELRQGGADLVKLDQDPMAEGFNFDDILHFRTTLYGNAVTFPLLENPDGVLYYKDRDNQVHWYRADQVTRTIQAIELSDLIEQQVFYTQLLEKMESMLPMSARRSNNTEHLLFAKIMKYTDKETQTKISLQIIRNGIDYEQDGIQYRDTHHDFNRYYHAYRKYIRPDEQQQHNEIDHLWIREVGHVQREVIWLLQRYCEENRPFRPCLSPTYKSEPFHRGFKFYTWTSDNHACAEDIYHIDSGAFHPGFGTEFGLYKSIKLTAIRNVCSQAAEIELIAISELVKDAKKNVSKLLNIDLDRPGPRP